MYVYARQVAMGWGKSGKDTLNALDKTVKLFYVFMPLDIPILSRDRQKAIMKYIFRSMRTLVYDLMI